MTIPAGTESDAELITRTRAGDMSAYDELYRRHVDDATKVARIVTHNSDESQDVVSEAFTRVLTRLREGGGPDEELAPYLKTVVRRLAIDRHRTSQRTGQPADPALLDVLPGADDPMARATDRELVRQAFETLPERWQQVLWHTEIEGRSPASLASRLGSSPNAVAALAYRAREGLRQAYLAVNLSTDVRPECRPHAPKIAAYVRGTLPTAQSTGLVDHLGQCSFCRERRDELLLLVSDLRATLWPALLWPVAGSAGVAAAAAGAGAAAGGGGLLAWFSPARWAGKGGRVMATTAGVVAAGVIAAVALTAGGGDTPPEAPVGAVAPPAASPDPEQPPPPDEPPADVPPASPPAQQPPASDPPSASPSPSRSASPSPSPTPTRTPSTTPSPTPSPSPPSSPTPSPPPNPDTPPVIDAQPQSIVVRAGEPATLSVAISGRPMPTLQWQVHAPAGAGTARAAAGDAGWTDVSDASTDTLTIPAPDSGDDGSQYRLVATNPAGSITTDPAVLTVQYAPEVVVAPADTSLDLGDALVLEARAAANPALTAAVWQVRAGSDGAWSNLPDTVTDSSGSSQLTVTGLRLDDDGDQYRVVFTNSLGATSTTPVDVSITAPGSLRIMVPTSGEKAVLQCAQPVDDEVRLGDCDNSARTTWRVHADQTLRFGGQCLDAGWLPERPNLSVFLTGCSGAASQQWNLDPTTQKPQEIRNGDAMLGGRCLGVLGLLGSERPVAAVPCVSQLGAEFSFVPR